MAALLAAFGALSVSRCQAVERADPPAQVRLRFQDEQGAVVPGVRLRVEEGSGRAQPPGRTLTADAQGELKFQLVRPDHVGSLTWDGQVRAEAPGYQPADVHLSPFPDARIDEVITLRSLRATLIRLRGPQDQPLAHVPLQISRAHWSDRRNFVTDDRGECEWLHGDLPEGFHILGRPESERLPDGPLVTVRYDENNLPPAERLVSGTLVEADGSAAAGWLVARRTWFDSSGGSLPIGPMWNFMEVEDIRPVGAAGQFEASVAKYLAVVSPEGIPFLYELAPQTWPMGVRQITLRIPPLRSVHKGQMADADGKPVTDLPIEIESIAWKSENWRIRLAAHDRVSRDRLPGAIAADGSLVGRLHTDADGCYALPTWYGTVLTARGWGDDWTIEGDLERAPRSVWRRRFVRKEQPYKNNRAYKNVTIVFEDERGQTIPGLQCQPVAYLSDGKRADLLGTGRDSRGYHIFVEPAAVQLELDVHDSREKWAPFQKTLDVQGEGDRLVAVRPDVSKRRLPLAGRVLNPDGQPARDVRLYLYRTKDESRGVPGPDYLKLSATTDADGKFHFDAAPDRCLIELPDCGGDSAETMKGWIGMVPVDRQNRDVTIKLLAGGRVKLLLPHNIGTDANGLYLKRENMGDDVDDRRGSVYFLRSADRTQLTTRVVRPGRYRLINYEQESAEAVAALGPVSIDLQPGQEVVVDLRDRALPARRPSAPVAKDWHTITVCREREVVSGAEVSVLDSVALPEQLTRWIHEATSAATTPEVREAAIEMLENSGALAVDAIRAACKSEQRERLLRELGDIYYDGFRRELVDLSDRAGQVRCQLEAGRQCVAVARVRGRFIGWKAFIAGEHAIVVDLQPARSLEVRWLQLLPAEEYERPVLAGLRPAGPIDPGLRGLMSTLCNEYDSYRRTAFLEPDAVKEQRYPLQRTGPGVWSLEDLPVGMQGMVRLSCAASRNAIPPYQWCPVAIPAGDGVQHALCPQTACSWDTLSRRLSTWWYELRY